MLLSEMIAKGQRQLAEHGDGHVIDGDGYPINSFDAQVAEEDSIHVNEWSFTVGERFFVVESNR